jgi:hypothetical protein
MDPDAPEERPHFNLLTQELDELVTRSWNSPNALLLIARELLYRERRAAAFLRERVINRLTEILEERQAFLWPSTEPPIGPGQIDPEVFRNEWSPLSAMGYRVGMQGPADGDRQAILDRAYQGTIPPVNSAEYMSRWGKPKTSSRLERMANLIAANVRLKKRQDQTTFALAINEWERDLSYLKKIYYDGCYDGIDGFSWPGSHTNNE